MLPIFILAIDNPKDRDFAETLYYKYRDKIYREAYKILNNEQEAEDVTSDTFEKIINKLWDYHNKSDNELAGIFVTIAKHLAIDKYRRKNKIEFTPISEADDTYMVFDEVGDFIVEKELFEKLYQAIETLDIDCAQIIKLKLLYGYRDKKIAEMLNISDGNVRVKYHRAKKILSEYLKGVYCDG